MDKRVNWTKERCIQEAFKYQSRSEWKKKSGSSYNKALKNKWMDECCSNMIKVNNYKDYWKKEKCIEDALKYNTKTEWRKKSQNSYGVASRNKWIDECSSHMIKNKTKSYWTLKKCKEESIKYKKINEWSRKSGSSYKIAKLNGWLMECCKHMVFTGNRFKRLVYVVEFSDNSVYIGLTYNKEKRFLQHKRRKRGAVYKYIMKTGLNPINKTLSDYIDVKDAQKLECEMIKKYKEDGFNVLNLAPGGAIGGDSRIWTKEACKQEAIKYTSRSEWSNAPNGSYRIASNNGWIEECCCHMVRLHRENGYWTKKKCISEALKYKSISEWGKKSGSSYSKALKNKWVEECCCHMVRLNHQDGYWTKERCIQEAFKYQSRSEWKKKSGSSYNKALKNKWMDECCVNLKNLIYPNRHWTKERCVQEALKYQSKSEWKKKSGSSYSKSLKNKWMDECCSHMKVLVGYWTLQACKADACKYYTKSAWRKSSSGAYCAAHKNGWLDECCYHMGKS